MLTEMWKKAPKSSTNEMVVGLAGVILLVISRAPAYYIRLMLVIFISSVDVVLMILFTILISFLVILFIFSFGSFFLFFLGCDLVSSHSSRYMYSSFSCSVFWKSSGGLLLVTRRLPEDDLLAVFWRSPEDHQKNLFPPKYGKNKKHYDIREFISKITLLHRQLYHKPYNFLAYGRFGMTKVQCTPPNEKVWDFAKNELLWWEKIGKVGNQVKLAILSQSELLFGGKPGKS